MYYKSVQQKTKCYNKNNKCAVYGIVQYSTLQLWQIYESQTLQIMAKHAGQSRNFTIKAYEVQQYETT